MAAPAAATPSASAGCSVRAKDVFAKGSRLSSRADVRAITSDGEELWLHRMVLEMWSSLFTELCVAAEEAPEADAGSAPGGAPPAVVTIHLSDTAQELLPLLSCLYPTLAGTGAGARAANDDDGDAAGLSGAKLDASTALPLLRLADKYDIPHVIATAAATMTDHVIPRLAAAPTAAAAASYLQLPLPLAEGGAAASAEEEEAEAGVAEWVVCAVEAAARLGLRELEGAGVELLAAKFYDWGLQACPHLLVRLVHCLPPDALVDGLLCALTPTPPPPPPAVAHLAGECKDQHGPAASSGSSRMSSRLQQRGYATGLPPHRQPRGRAAAGGRQVAPGEGNGGGAAVAGAVGGGGGPRIVPVVIAAAGPAAAVAGAPPLLGPHHHHHHLNHHNHHQFYNHHNHHQFHHHAAAAGLPAAAAAAAAVPLHGPQPLLQPHPAAAMPVHPHLAMPVPVPVPVPAVAAAAPDGGGVGVGGAGGPAAHQPHPFAEVAAGGAVGGGGAVGVPVAFGAGAGAPPPPMFQHHQHQPHQHQHQQPEPFWGGGHAGGVMGPL